MPEPASLLAWVCRDQMAYLDLQQDPMELTPRGAQAPKDKSSTERLAIAKLLDAKVQEFERAGDDTPLGLLAHMAPYMELFHQLMLSADKGEMNSLCEAHPGLYRYARLLEHLAKGSIRGKSRCRVDNICPRHHSNFSSLERQSEIFAGLGLEPQKGANPP